MFFITILEEEGEDKSNNREVRKVNKEDQENISGGVIIEYDNRFYVFRDNR